MSLLKTPLYSWHKERANMVPFAGFSMPVVYTSPSSISIEHINVRNSAGIFDVSHMGRMLIKGNDALNFLNLLVPRELSNLPVNKVAYTFFLNELGGFRDDITVARTGESEYLVTWNAGNLWKIWHWMTDLASIFNSNGSKDLEIANISANTAMIAFQGPFAPELTKKIFGDYPGSWKIVKVVFREIDVLILGSGYTGESGCELVVFNTSESNPKHALTVWNALLAENGVIACGLGARDTLRTEAGMCLYGNDISEEISPIEAGLSFSPLVNFNKDFFIGKNVLESLEKKKHTLQKRVGILALKKGPSPRPGMKIFSGDTEIGHITSGSFSPLFKLGIGMAYVDRAVSIGKAVTLVDPKSSRQILAKISTFPLYNPDEYGNKRK